MATVDGYYACSRNDISPQEASGLTWSETDLSEFSEIGRFLEWNPFLAVRQRSTNRTFVMIDGVVFDTTDRVCKNSTHE